MKNEYEIGDRIVAAVTFIMPGTDIIIQKGTLGVCVRQDTYLFEGQETSWALGGFEGFITPASKYKDIGPEFKDMCLKFYVRDNAELNVAIQKRLFALGARWPFSNTKFSHAHATWIYLDKNTLSWCGESEKNIYTTTEATISDLFDIPVKPRTHTVTINDKDIILSEESYEAFKKQFS